MGKYVEYYYQNNRLQNMVDHIIKKHFGWIPQKDYDDFYSIAGQAVWYCEENFDETKGKNFEKYLVDSLYRKIKTQITYNNRKKRNSGMPVLSLEKIVDEESEMTIGDMIAYEESPEISPIMQRYIDSLTKKQKEIACLFMDGWNKKEIINKTGITGKRFEMIYSRMKSDEKVEMLSHLKGVKQ